MTTYTCGEFRVEVGNRRFVRDGDELALEPRVFAVISELLAKAGSLVTRNELLDAVWGHRYVTPSTLNRTITLARRAFGDESAEPHFIQTVHGAGYRFVGPVDVPASEPSASRAGFGPPSAARLPARIDALVGRETQLACLAELLAGNRAVTVVGSGGMGKTQCALEAARRGTRDFPDGVWFFDLAPLEEADEWLRTMGEMLGLASRTVEELLDKLCAVFRDRRALLLLDNCERLAAPLGMRVFQMLRATAALKVLATSQLPLNFSGEQLMRLPPLELPSADGDLESPAIVQFAAVDMMVRRIRAVQPQFELGKANARTIAEICIRLDGMPLALELAAARFALLSADQVHERLVQRFRFLGGDAAGRDLRHRSLQALLEWSYGLLSAQEEQLLNWCSVFVQTWTLEAAVSVAAALGHDPERAIDLLSSLVHHSLLSAVPGTSPPRYRLLETVRDYALTRLRSARQETPARGAHVHAMLQVCRIATSDILAGRMRQRVEQLTQELGNISAAIETSLRMDAAAKHALDLLGVLCIYVKAHGAILIVRRWCRTVFASSPATDTPERARALLTYGLIEVHAVSGNTGMLLEAARIAVIHGDRWTEAYANGYYAMSLADQGKPEEARSHAQLAERYAQQHADASLAGLAGLARAWIGLARGDPQAALRELLTVRAAGADLHQQHFIEVYLGLALFVLGNDAGAATHWLRAMELSFTVGNIRGTSGSIEGCAYIAARTGDWRCAARLLGAARAIRERTEIPVFSFWRTHQQAAHDTLCAQLSPADLEAETRRGLQMRQEDAANETQAVLWQLAGNAERRSTQRTTKRPAGS